MLSTVYLNLNKNKHFGVNYPFSWVLHITVLVQCMRKERSKKVKWSTKRHDIILFALKVCEWHQVSFKSDLILTFDSALWFEHYIDHVTSLKEKFFQTSLLIDLIHRSEKNPVKGLTAP